MLDRQTSIRHVNADILIGIVALHTKGPLHTLITGLEGCICGDNALQLRTEAIMQTTHVLGPPPPPPPPTLCCLSAD